MKTTGAITAICEYQLPTRSWVGFSERPPSTVPDLHFFSCDWLIANFAALACVTPPPGYAICRPLTMRQLGAVRRTLLAYVAPRSSDNLVFGALMRSHHDPSGFVGCLVSVVLPPSGVSTSPIYCDTSTPLFTRSSTRRG